MDRISWTERFKPKNICEITLNENIKKDFLQIITTKNTNNLILCGGSGVGKTSVVKCLIDVFYGQYLDFHVLEISSFEDRGIKIQEDIENFCRTMKCYKTEDKEKYVDFKMIILDEADNITSKAQRVINSMLDEFKNSTKFVFICNSSSSIISAIQSKCKIVKFPPLTVSEVEGNLLNICTKNNFSYSTRGINIIASNSRGDMRNALNVANTVYDLYKEITESSVCKIYNNPEVNKITFIISKCVEKDLKNAIFMINELKNEGHNNKDILSCMFNVLCHENVCVEMSSKMHLCDKIAETLYKTSKGSFTDLQLYSCIVQMTHK